MTVQTRSVVRGDGGEFSLSWSDAYSIRGQIQSLRDMTISGTRSPDGKEYQFASATISDTDFLITTRSLGTKPTSKDRLVYGTRVFNIVSVVDSEEIKHCRFIYVKEQNEDVAEDSTVSASMYSFRWGSGSFLTALAPYTQDAPAGKTFFPKRLEGIVDDLDGTVLTQPTISVGITGNLTKYLNAVTFTQLNEILASQDLTLFGADGNEGTDHVVFSFTPGTVDTGDYDGSLVLWGDLVG